MIQFNLISVDVPRKFSDSAKLVGGKLFERCVKMLGQHELSEEVEYYSANGREDVASENTPDISQSTSDGEYEPPQKISTYRTVPFDIKMKIVMTVKEHPNWTFRTLQQRFRKHLRHHSDVTRLRKDVLSGGNFRDKLQSIKRNVYDRFTEARRNKQPVTRHVLQQWAMVAAVQFHEDQEDGEGHKSVFNFIASSSWLTTFLREYKVSNRRVVRYIKKKETISPETLMKSAIHFQAIVRLISRNYDPDFVINTDQMSCEYEMNVSRTHTAQLYIGDLNKVSRSYTVQYSLTKSGKLLNKVFVCLQEFADSFEAHVQKDVDDLLKLCRNVVVVCSKFGKLTTSLYKEYLKSVVEPYVRNDPFLFIVDSWEGQKDFETYNEIFRDDNNESTCNLQLIPQECTQICQPCDVYFYRQVNNLMRKIQTCPDLLADAENVQLNTRADAIRIQSLTHYLLSAPEFKCMLKYAWYASKLADDRDIFYNVNQLCFPSNIHSRKCVCGQRDSFIKCSWCCNFLCFHCFYTNFHPRHCDTMADFYNSS